MDNEPANIKAFNYLTLKIFTKLYDVFPEPQKFDSLEFVIGEAAQHPSDSKEAAYGMLVDDTMEWLREEGFIRWKDHIKGGSHYHGVVLTLKGLTVLGYVPTAVEGQPDQTLIQRASQVVQKEAEGAAGDVVRSIFRGSFQMAANWYM